jgi:tellurite resistance protein
MSTIADELKARFAACRYLERLKRNKKLAREVMKTNVVVRNQAGFLEVLPRPTVARLRRIEL